MKFKRLIALILAMCCVLPFATGCNVDEYGDKTVINFMNFNGGIGSLWLEKAADRFSELKADTSYATGKQGVKINIDKSMSVDTGTMNSTDYHIYTSEQFETAVPMLLALEGKLLDITDIVTDTSREGGSIDANLFEQTKGSLGLEEDGEFHYYGLPNYEHYSGLQYNHGRVQSFRDNLGLFLASDEETDVEVWDSKNFGEIRLIGSKDAELSAGPDGVKGTTDDGLPASMRELLAWLDWIKDKNIAPINVAGQYLYYSNYLAAGLFASLAGQEQMSNYNNSDGWVEVVKREGSGGLLYTEENLFPGIGYIKKPQTEWIKLTAKNGYRCQDMVAKYYTAAFFEMMVREGFMSEDSTVSTKTHYDAQASIFMGDIDAGYSDAVLCIEASYWYGEAEEGGTFNLYEGVTGNSAKDLDLRMYPLPSVVYDDENEKIGSSAFDESATDKYGEHISGRATTFIDVGHCYMFVNKNIEKNAEIVAAVKDFVAFLYTEDELAAFTVETGEPRSIKYDLTDAQLEAAGSYVANLWSLRDNEKGSNIVYCSGTTATFKKARGSLKMYLFCEVFKTDGYKDYLTPIRAGKNTVDIFEGSTWSVAEWRNLVGSLAD